MGIYEDWKKQLFNQYKEKLIMQLLFQLLLLFWLLAVKEEQKQVQMGSVAIFPKPQTVLVGQGNFEFKRGLKISVENEEQKKIVQKFVQQFQRVAGWSPEIMLGRGGAIQLVSDYTLATEAYKLSVSNSEIKLIASGSAGFLYGLESLKQMMPVSFFGTTPQPDLIFAVPAVEIKDFPAFEWRGYLLDASRHFFSKEQVFRVLDFMTELKLNKFHWHLTDDQGWRLEIKQYPNLTKIGAWRMDYNVRDEETYNWFGRPVQKLGEKPTYGGYYTQEDVREVIAYAKERNIDVIPEIDMPGHAQAAIAAYPFLGCVNAAPFVATGGVVKNNTYNPGKEETFEFVENLLNEVMDLFPSQYIHIGGDECDKSQWRIDPFAQQRMKDENLKDEFELQSYFIKRVEKLVNARGRKIIGWDEILEGGLAPNAVVMSWRGEAGGLASIKAGHEVIMTPNSYCYIDLKQGQPDMEPNLGYDQLTLSKTYSYQVIPDSLSPDQSKLIKGIQANMWTESITDWGKLTYMTFPRLYAIAENAWTKQENKDWIEFTQRLETQFARLDLQQVRYAVSALSPKILHKKQGEKILVELNTEFPNLDIYYTLNGTEPTLASIKYKEPFLLSKTAIVKARSFNNKQPVGYLSHSNLSIHKAAGVSVRIKNSTQTLPKLTDLEYAQLDNTDTRWQVLPSSSVLDISFDKPTTISTLQFAALRYTISSYYPPVEVELLGSVDGVSFKKLGAIKKEEAFIQGRNKIEYFIRFPSSRVKKIQINLKGIELIPEGHFAAGGKSSILIDEMVFY